MPPDLQSIQRDAIGEIAKRVGRRWPIIDRCLEAAHAEREKLAKMLAAESLVPADCSFVVFGSIARGEATQGSDLDWTLLVDGQADPHHQTIAQTLRVKLDERGVKLPGPTAVFGGLTFSHELIHHIGGDGDTNGNTTRRILLLLESCEIGPASGARDRVMRHVLRRYLEQDRG